MPKRALVNQWSGSWFLKIGDWGKERDGFCGVATRLCRSLFVRQPVNAADTGPRVQLPSYPIYVRVPDVPRVHHMD